MRTLVDVRWLFALSVAAWACAKANPTDDGGSYTPTGTGGSAQGTGGVTGGTLGTGAVSPTGGSTSIGGSNATGGTTSTGGSTATGGSGDTTSAGGTSATGGTGASSGGTTSTGGSHATGGTAAATGGSSSSAGGTTATGGTGTATAGSSSSAGGSMSSGGPPATSIAGDGSLILFYKCVSAMAMSPNVNMSIYIRNQTSDAIDLSMVEVRYWMTAEPASPATHSYYSATGVDAKTPTWVAGPPSYVSFTFSKGGTIAANEKDLNKTEMQGTIDAPTGTFDQSDDWSFAPKSTTPQPNPNITLYVAGKLKWGCEPSGVCAGGMVTPAMGQGGMPATGGQSGTPAAGTGGDLGAAGAP